MRSVVLAHILLDTYEVPITAGVGLLRMRRPGRVVWMRDADAVSKMHALTATVLALLGAAAHNCPSAGDWALYTASPLRAFESELGVQAPTGFWDPLGLSKDGDVAAGPDISCECSTGATKRNPQKQLELTSEASNL